MSHKCKHNILSKCIGTSKRFGNVYRCYDCGTNVVKIKDKTLSLSEAFNKGNFSWRYGARL